MSRESSVVSGEWQVQLGGARLLSKRLTCALGRKS